MITHNLRWLAVIGTCVCIAATIGAYISRKGRDPTSAKQLVIIEPMFYGFQFVFTSVLIYYVFLGPRHR